LPQEENGKPTEIEKSAKEEAPQGSSSLAPTCASVSDPPGTVPWYWLHPSSHPLVIPGSQLQQDIRRRQRIAEFRAYEDKLRERCPDPVYVDPPTHPD
jgi:hypothetical protein